MLDFEDAPNDLLTSDMDKIGQGKCSQKEIITLDKREDVDSQHHFTTADLSTDIRNDEEEQKDSVLLDTFADKLLNSFVKDTVKQFAEIKKAKEQKIEAANQMNGDLFDENVEEQEGFSSVEQKDGLPFFLPAEQEELSSPELCNRPVSACLWIFSNLMLFLSLVSLYFVIKDMNWNVAISEQKPCSYIDSMASHFNI